MDNNNNNNNCSQKQQLTLPFFFSKLSCILSFSLCLSFSFSVRLSLSSLKIIVIFAFAVRNFSPSSSSYTLQQPGNSFRLFQQSSQHTDNLSFVVLSPLIFSNSFHSLISPSKNHSSPLSLLLFHLVTLSPLSLFHKRRRARFSAPNKHSTLSYGRAYHTYMYVCG